jgi:hypothetical protein
MERLAGLRRAHDAAALAETDARMAFALAVSAKNYFVAVFKKFSCLTIRNLKRFCSAARDFKQAAERVPCRPGDRSTGEQITGV